MTELDFDVIDFAQMLAALPEHLPISDAFEQADPQKNGHWWSSQREHMTSWFKAQATKGSGGFTRNIPNHSARTTYNRLRHPEGIVWIAEALGVDTATVHAAADAGLNVGRRGRSGVVRKHLPWRLIAERANAQMESSLPM